MRKSVLKFTMVAIKFSRIITDRIERHSFAFSCSNMQTDSKAIFTLIGGFAIERTSTRCCFFIDLTANNGSLKFRNKRRTSETYRFERQ